MFTVMFKNKIETSVLRAFLVLCGVCYGAVILPVTELPPSWQVQGWQAEAKKKKLSPAMLKKELLSLQPEIVRLLGKSRSRGLFSPEDAQVTTQIRETLNLLISSSPKAEELVEPAYQAGQLFMARELYFDSYEAFAFIEAKFPKSAYAPKAMFQKRAVLKKMSPDDRAILEEQAVLASTMAATAKVATSSTVAATALPVKITPTPKK